MEQMILFLNLQTQHFVFQDSHHATRIILISLRFKKLIHSTSTSSTNNISWTYLRRSNYDLQYRFLFIISPLQNTFLPSPNDANFHSSGYTTAGQKIESYFSQELGANPICCHSFVRIIQSFVHNCNMEPLSQPKVIEIFNSPTSLEPETALWFQLSSLKVVSPQDFARPRKLMANGNPGRSA